MMIWNSGPAYHPNPVAAASWNWIGWLGSESLRKQYLSEELFVAHWLGIRRRYRLIAQYDTEAAASLDQQLKKEWDSTPALQAEFNDNFSHCAAFVRADRQGAVRIAGRK